MRAPFLATFLLVSAAQAAGTLGAETCKSCHAEAYEAWSHSAHARSGTSLTPVQAKSALCAQCHIPSANVDASVSCESCHGAGAAYAPRYVMRDAELARAVGLVTPDSKTCAVCHTDSSPSLQKFDVAEKLPLIDHWSAERARRAGKKSAQNVSPLWLVNALVQK